jgi:hypothetical protein
MLLIQALMQILMLRVEIFMSCLVRSAELAVQATMLSRGHVMLVSFFVRGVQSLMSCVVLSV